MKRDAAEILKEALALPTEARAALAGSLLDSLDAEVDEDAEAAWATEVNRRVAELDSGAVSTSKIIRSRTATRSRQTPQRA
jgi:putative addiction module component (TIGR02574 family)